MNLAKRYAYICKASLHLSLPSFIPATIGRKSDETPDTAIIPDFLFNTSLTSSGVMPILSHKKNTTEASMQPLRVPMIRPSNGVKPIEVSTHLPPLTAVTEAPLPK